MRNSVREIMLNRHPSEVTRKKLDLSLNFPKSYPPIKARPTTEGGVRDKFFASVAELPDEMTVIHPFNVNAFAKSNENTVHVYPGESIQKAVDSLKGKLGGKVILHEGVYMLTEGVKITEEHSGTDTSPFIITAAEGETPIVTGSTKIPYESFGPVTDEKILKRLKSEVHDKVLVSDLKALGITDYGELGHNNATLTFNNIKKTIARYPNEGEKLIVMSKEILDPGGHEGASPTSRSRPGNDPFEIGISDDRCLEWEFNEDIWLFGALYAEWGRSYANIAEFNRERHSMRSKKNFYWGVHYEPNNDYYFFNVLEELDVPGEWYIDRKEGKLYIIPDEDFTVGADVRLITNGMHLFELVKTENAIIDRITGGLCRGSLVSMKYCRHCLVQRCHAIGICGASEGDRGAVHAYEGYNCGIIDTLIEFCSSRAATIYGGDRDTYTPGHHFIQNCKVINPYNRFGMAINGGVANLISHNYLHNTTTSAGGEIESVMEYNIIEGGDTEACDTGMIYVGGGGGTACGNHYRYNYFFNFVKGDYGIYFDDLSRGMYAYGNIIVGNGNIDNGRQWVGGGRSFNHHNGGEHCFWNNISVDAGYFAFGGDISYWIDENFWAALREGVTGCAERNISEAYLERNPTFREYLEACREYREARKAEGYIPKSCFAEKRLRMPWCNHYENNLIVRANRPYKLDNGIESATGLETNYITNSDPGFVDIEGGDFRFREDSDIFEKIPGFIAPPFEKMGIVG